jgi:hypothetical protein
LGRLLFSLALFFFVGLGRWTARLQPLTLALVALAWATFTSAFEWLVLVPLFPFWQPIFTLQQPYWIGFLVHFRSPAGHVSIGKESLGIAVQIIELGPK